mmetsp:Transcript_109226/g.337280  ORF Transcript_109226/g.337280 Transcript_109226/m.337280 type:complete len:202 (+) Transcript_109226:1193-1798(+)
MAAGEDRQLDLLNSPRCHMRHRRISRRWLAEQRQRRKRCGRRALRGNADEAVALEAPPALAAGPAALQHARPARPAGEEAAGGRAAPGAKHGPSGVVELQDLQRCCLRPSLLLLAELQCCCERRPVCSAVGGVLDRRRQPPHLLTAVPLRGAADGARQGAHLVEPLACGVDAGAVPRSPRRPCRGGGGGGDAAAAAAAAPR